MHIPDGFLEARVWIPAAAVSAVGLGACARKLAAAHEGRQVPLMGVTAAFIFAAQMLNFPVLGGTSGHLLG
nr:energy-coupling factor ABC transporter permease [bacterium]